MEEFELVKDFETEVTKFSDVMIIQKLNKMDGGEKIFNSLNDVMQYFTGSQEKEFSKHRLTNFRNKLEQYAYVKQINGKNFLVKEKDSYEIEIKSKTKEKIVNSICQAVICSLINKQIKAGYATPIKCSSKILEQACGMANSFFWNYINKKEELVDMVLKSMEKDRNWRDCYTKQDINSLTVDDKKVLVSIVEEFYRNYSEKMKYAVTENLNRLRKKNILMYEIKYFVVEWATDTIEEVNGDKDDPRRKLKTINVPGKIRAATDEEIKKRLQLYQLATLKFDYKDGEVSQKDMQNYFRFRNSYANQKMGICGFFLGYNIVGNTSISYDITKFERELKYVANSFGDKALTSGETAVKNYLYGKDKTLVGSLYKIVDCFCEKIVEKVNNFSIEDIRKAEMQTTELQMGGRNVEIPKYLDILDGLIDGKGITRRPEL